MKYLNLDTDTTLGGDNASDQVVSSQKALKTYIDSRPSGGTVDQTFDGTSANAQSGVAIEGELANYVKSQNGNITISNNGTEASIVYMYEEEGTPQQAYGITLGDTSSGDGVFLVSADRAEQKGYMAGVVPDGFGIEDVLNNRGALLSVLSNGNLAVNGTEVALSTDIPDISTKQDTLVSGTNIKTINNNSLLGSGNITIDSLPSQSGQSGKFLTTNGTTASWSTVSIPTVDQTFDSSSANAQSGVAIAGELANYLQASSGNVTFTNGGTVGGITYEDSGTGEMYGTFIGYTPFGQGVMMGAVDPNGYLLGVTSSGINILKGTTTSPTNGIALTVTNNNTLAIGGDEVATQTWVGNQGYITSAALSTLTDVALSSPTQGQNLTYDATLGKWKNTSTTATVAWGGITGTLADQTDLNTALGGKQDTLVSGTNIKTINSTSLLGSGNITIDSLPSQSGQSGKYLTTNGTTASWSTISMPTVDQTYDSTSTNAQSGVAIAGELTNYLQNTATGNNSLSILGTTSSAVNATSIGVSSIATASSTAIGYNTYTLNGCTALGNYAQCTNGVESVAIGYLAKTDAGYAIQIGRGTNTTASTLSIGFGAQTSSNAKNWQLLDGTTGLIPDARISTNIARASDIPTNISDLTDDTATNPVDKADTLTGLTATITELNYTDGVTSNIQTQFDTINGKIPSQASTSNQLADKAFVNSSVQTATANFRGNWSTWANVPTSASSYPADYAGSTTPTVNDYMVVQDASDYTGDTLEGTWRFKYTGVWSTNGKSGWNPEYQVNETPLTSAQLAALNSGITSNDVTLIGTALQPNDNISSLTNNAGYITGISSSDVTSALGYTPYNSTNPNGYITSSALSGYLQNTATGTNSLTLLGTATSSNTAINIGYNSSTTTGGTVAIGTNANTSGTASISIGANTESSGIDTIAIGDTAKATANNAIQIGYGTNNTANKFNVRSYELLDLSTGYIPDARISSNIARTSAIPTVPTNVSAFTNDAGYLTSIPSGYLQNTATATNSLTILGTTNNQNNSILIGYSTTTSSTNSTVIGNTAVSGGSYATALGYYARANGQYTTAIGNSSYANYQDVTAVGHNSQATAAGTLAVGSNSKATAQRATSIGYSSQATQYQATALGYEAKATANSALQIGTGTNSTANTLQVGSYTLLNTSTGLIPDARISSNIARTSQITTPTYDSTNERITW